MTEASVMLLGPPIHGMRVYSQVYSEMEKFKPHAVTIEADSRHLDMFRPLFYSGISGEQLVGKWLERRPEMHLMGVPWEIAAAVTYARDHDVPCYPIDNRDFNEKEVLGHSTRRLVSERLKRIRQVLNGPVAGLKALFRTIQNAVGGRKKEPTHPTSKEGMDRRNRFMARMIEKVAEKHATEEGSVRIAHAGGAGHYRGDKRRQASGKSCIQDYLNIKSVERILTDS